MSSSSADQQLIKSPIRFYIRKNKRVFVVGVFALAATNFLDALPPYFVGKAIDQIGAAAPFNDVLHTIGVLFAITFSLALVRFTWRYMWGQFSHTSAMDLQNHLFAKYTRLGQSYLRKTPVGELMSLMINDIQAFRMAVGPGILIILDALFILMIVPPMMISISPSWTWRCLILMPFLPFIANRLMTALNAAYEERQNEFAVLSGFAQEVITGVRVIKSYVQEFTHTKLFNIRSREFENVSNKTAFLDAAFTPPLEFAITFGSVVLLIIGAPDVMSGAVSVGSLFAFYQYIQRMEWPATAIGLGMSHIQQGQASFARIRQVLEIPDEIVDTGAEDFDSFHSLEVRHLSFSYPAGRANVLRDISFSLKSGEILGIIGPTGAGKTSLIDVLGRIFNPTSGEILYNGRPIEKISMKSLRQIVTVVPQDAFLFSNKVSENISLGLDLPQTQIESLVHSVDLSDEIRTFPGEYDAYLGERGINLSGGQKQRLTLARALARKTPLILIDDSLSAVDSKTEEKILKQLRGLLSSAIVISHRIESVRWAHKIMVLKEGAVEALGTHDELMKSSATYQHLYQLQKDAPEPREVTT